MYLRSRGSLLVNSNYYMMVRREARCGRHGLGGHDRSPEHCLEPLAHLLWLSGALSDKHGLSVFCVLSLRRQAGFLVRHAHTAAGCPRRQCCPRPAPVPPPSEPAGDSTGKADLVDWGWRCREHTGPGSGALGLLQTLLMGMRPLCSAQFERIFNTTRVPGLEKGEDAPPPSPCPFLPQ